MNNIKILIEKYFEGLTSLDEEQQLRDYFRQENVPQELEMYKPLFQYFVSEREACASLRGQSPKQSTPSNSPQFPSFGGIRGGFWGKGSGLLHSVRNDAVHKVSFFLRWGSIAAAACLLLFISLRLFLNTGGTLPETSQAYIDGKRYTDIELIRTETLKSLDNLSEGSEDAYSSQIEALEIFTK